MAATAEGEKRMTESEERTWATFCHLGGLAMFVVPLGNVLVPLILWLLKKDQSSFVDEHGKAALNFQISMSVYFLVGILLMVFVALPLTLVLVGFVFIIGMAMLFGALKLFNIVCLVIAAVKANQGESFDYPLAIPFLR